MDGGLQGLPLVIPNPKPSTRVSTYDHPVQSLVWDDFTAEPGHDYDVRLPSVQRHAGEP